MPIQWTAKAPGEVDTREWEIPVADGDSVQSYTVSATGGATVDGSERSGDIVTITFSAGTDGQTTIVTLDATTTGGLQLDETAYLPIRATPNAFTYTVRDVCNFAMRPIVGLGATASADELADAQENLDDMLAEWAASGADLGIKLPTASSDVLYASDAFISAIKHNLRTRIAELYGKPVDQVSFMAGMRGLQQIKTALLPDDRADTYY